MSIQAVSHSPQPQQSAKASELNSGSQGQSSAPKTAAPQAQPKDAVQISSAAKQALQEATETAAQTAKEAQGGDLQAKRLLSKENAAKAAQQPPANTENGGVENLLK